MKISAYIPCYNNRHTIVDCIAAVQAQQYAVDELFVVDDGSTDGSLELIQSLGIRVLCSPYNLGRGAVRAKAMSIATNEFVLCCDATNTLAPNFTANAVSWFGNPRVAAVYGKITQMEPQNVVERWRGRHLFNLGKTHTLTHGASLITTGAMVRRSAVMAVGNYAGACRHSEDADLGARLFEAKYDVIYDPRLLITSIAKNSLLEVLERYWRWHVGANEPRHGADYLRNIVYSAKVMVKEDLQAGDLFSVPISLISPHYQFLRSLFRSRQAGPSQQ